MRVQGDYFAGYRSVKLTRDAAGVLISYQRRAVQIHDPRSYRIRRCVLPDRARSKQQDRNSDRSKPRTHGE